MIWLSSYPRSGNTFFRNVLIDVYGLESSSFYDNVGLPENYVEYPFVKTHNHPHEIVPLDDTIPAVYLVRDGRDAIVSMAHQQKDIYGNEAPFDQIIKEAIQAANNSYFGGWSSHVNHWLQRSELIIRFEELVQNPIKEIDRINAIQKLPEKKEENLPTFDSLKHGKPTYGRGKRVAKSEKEELDIIRKSFRRGKSFGWRDELSRELQNYYWSYHRVAMERMGYSREGGLVDLHDELDYDVLELLGKPTSTPERKFKVLVEANKLLMHQNDGVKRYLVELLKAIYPVTTNPNSKWQIDVFLNGKIYSLEEYGVSLFKEPENDGGDGSGADSKSISSMRSVAKAIVPRKVRDKVREPALKAAVKVGLKFSKSVAYASYMKDRVTEGKSVAKEKYKLHTDALEHGGYDLIHVPLPQHYEPFLGAKTNKYLVTVHDLTHQLFSGFHTTANVQKAEKGLKFFKENDADFLCISEATRSDLIAHSKPDSNKMHIVYEAADSLKFKPIIHKDHNAVQRLRESYDIPDGPYLFTLSTIEPRKNLMNTIKAFDLLLDENPDLKVNLVIGGKNGWKSKDLMKLHHKENLVFTGFVDENHLPTLYNEAEALCYVSHYEGFGLPPMEAMSCKTPVIFGNNSSMKELFTGYGLPADSNDVEDIKNQMKLILTDTALKMEMQEKSLERTFDFSWRKTAIDTLNVYENVILNRS